MPVEVLIVEDYDRDRARYIDHFRRHAPEGYFKLHIEMTLEFAWRRIQVLSPEVIIMDGCLESGELDTLPLIHLLVESGFQGMLIAASGIPAYRQRMVDAGCTHQASKEQVISVILSEYQLPLP